MERTVTVWGKPHTIKISQSSRVSFTAAAMFQGDILIARGHSAAAALAAWCSSAKSKTAR